MLLSAPGGIYNNIADLGAIISLVGTVAPSASRAAALTSKLKKGHVACVIGVLVPGVFRCLFFVFVVVVVCCLLLGVAAVGGVGSKHPAICLINKPTYLVLETTTICLL